MNLLLLLAACFSLLILLIIYIFLYNYSIKKRRESNKELNETRSILRSLSQKSYYWEQAISSIEDGLIAVNSEGIIQFCNCAAGRILDKTCTELVKQRIKEVFPVVFTHNEQIVSDIELLSYKRKNHTLVYPVLSKNGEKIILDLTVSDFNPVSQDQAGKILLFRDITAKYNNTMLLLDNEKKMRLFFELFPFSILIYTNNKWIFINELFKKKTGITIDELNSSGLKISDALLLIGNSTPISSWDLHIINDKEFFIKSERKEIWFEYNIHKFELSPDNAFMIIAKEITVRKRDEVIKDILYNVSCAAHKKETEKDFYETVYNELCRIIHSRNLTIAIVDEKKLTISSPYYNDEYDSYGTLPLEKTLSAIVVSTASPLFLKKKEIEKMITDGVIDTNRTVPEVWIGVPLIQKGSVIGTLIVQDYHDPLAITSEDYNLLQQVSEQIAASIEHRLAISALVESERKFRLMAENNPGVIYIYDMLPSGKREKIYVGPGLVKLIGIDSANKSYADVQEFFDLIPQEDQQRLMLEAEKAEMANKNLDIEYRLKKNKEFVWVRSISSSVKMAGNVQRVFGMLVDITEQKKILSELIETKTFLNYSLNQTPSGIIIADKKLRLSFINNRATEMMNLSEEDKKMSRFGFGRKWKLFDSNNREISIRDLPITKAIFHNIVEKNKEYRVWHEKLNDRWMLVNTSPIYGEKEQLLGAIAIFNDITTMKEFEKSLNDMKNRFETLTENSPYGIIMFNEKKLPVYMNSGITDITGFSQEEITDQETWFNKLYPEENYRHHVYETWEKALSEQKYSATKKFRIVTKSGDEKFVNFHFKPLNDKEMMVTLDDVTQKVKAENKLIEAQKMDSIGNLAGGVAHDFNNMLGGISGYTSLLLLDENNLEKREYLNGIMDAVEKSSALTRNLLAFGRRGKNIVEAVNLNSVIKEITAILMRSLEKNIDFEFLLEPALSTVDADPSQMNQMIMNLCINAAEAMPGGGKITFSTHNIRQEIVNTDDHPDLNQANYISLEITDTGIGMSAEILHHLFEPFFTTKHEGSIKGTGLGLATVYGIVKNHHGSIHVDSKPGLGSNFQILLPQGVKPVQQKSVKTAASKFQGQGMILIVDDEDIVRNTYKMMVESLGYKTVCAVDGEDAISIYRERENEIDLVILDVKMPKKSGKETFREMNQINPDIKVIVSTGYGHNEEVQEILDLGAGMLLGKPFDITDLADALKYMLES